MNVSELRSLISDEQMPLTDIETIFRALVGYPSEEHFHNSTRADRTAALEPACRSLVGDMEQMPQRTIQAIVGAAGVPAGDGTYNWGADTVSEHSEVFVTRLRQ